MISFLSDEVAKYTLGEGALLALVGFIIVLLVLALFVGIFILSGMIFKKMDEKKATKPSAPAASTVAESEDGDEEVVAAITAAISCILSEESGEQAPDFVIKRVKRIK